MNSTIREYGSRSPTRGRPGSRFDSYLDTGSYSDTRENIAPSRNRSSTPSAAVRRAMQVLDETKRQQLQLKNDRWYHSVDYDGKFEEPIRSRRSPSPIRSRSVSPTRNFSTSLWAPSRLVEIERENFQDALGDSEARREILLNKLSDAQKTMEIQNERLRDGEMDIGECRATIRLLKQVQQELETKTQFLQKERGSFLAKSRRDAEEKECLRRKLEDANHEGNKFKCQLDLLLADKQQHHVTLEHMHKSVKDLKDQIKSCSEIQAATRLELDTSKQQSEVAKQRVELLEKEKVNAISELEKSQNKQQSLINRNTEMGERLSRCQHDLRHLSEKLDKTNFNLGHHREELAMCRETIKKQNRDLVDLQRSHAEMQSDRERALRYNEELEKTLHSMKEVNHDLKQLKVSHENDITELHASLAKTRLELTKVDDENETKRVELDGCRKEIKNLSRELMKLQPENEDLRLKVQEWEGSHSVDVQKLALIEAQKSQLTLEKDDVTTRLSALKDSYDELKCHHEREMKSLNKEVKELRQEKERNASQCRDAQAQYNRIRDEMESNNQHTQAQLDHWRQACSKLTSLVEEKDESLRECLAERREAEEGATLVEAQNRTLEMQLSERLASQEELSHLRMEQKRLSQECAENQQMIAVLEMQRDILAKSPSKSTGSSDVAASQMEKLKAEIELLRSKLKEVEAEREKLLLDRRDGSLLNTSDIGNSSNNRRLKGMNQILAEQVASLKQEAETLQNLLDDKSRLHDRATKEWKREKQQLDLRMASMIDELNALKSDQSRKSNESNSEVKAIKAELQWMRQDLEEKKQELAVTSGELVVMENAKKRADDRVAILQASLEEPKSWRNKKMSSEQINENATADSRIKNAKLDAAEAEIAVLRIQAQELEHTKSSQNTLIEALKRQVEKNNASSGESETSNESRSPSNKEIKQLKKELERAVTDMRMKEKQLLEMKKKLVETQKSEQRARQERDELQGKAIIMESLNDSSQDLLKELKKVQQEKSFLEQQLNNFATTKTCQTPPTTLSLVEDLDRELERQYETVCERNTWLESRIASLQREIELLRDQNSLAQEQKVSAEREALRLREEIKNLRMTSKGSRQQSEVEQIHLQHQNAEKMQKILDLERDLSEKKQLIRAMTKEMENLQKKSEKGKISSFMKKLRRSSDSSRFLESSMNGQSTATSGFGSPLSSMDPGYSTMSTGHARQKRAKSLSPVPNSPSSRHHNGSRSFSKSPKIKNIPIQPLSPTLTFVSALDQQSGTCTPSTSNRFGKDSPNRVPGIRVSFEESSGHEDEATGDSPSSKHDTRSCSHDSSKHDSSRADDGAFFAEDYITEDSQPHSMSTSKERLSHPPSPESYEPHPEMLKGLPSPTSSPSLPSPSTKRLRDMPIHDESSSEESEPNDSGSEEVEAVSRNLSQYPPPMRALPLNEFSSLGKQNRTPPRPKSQPTFSGSNLSSVSSQTKKKNLSLV